MRPLTAICTTDLGLLLKLVDHLAALGTAHHCLAVVATTREQRPFRRPRNGMHGAEVLKLVDHLAALGTAHYCLAVVASTREQRPFRRPRNGKKAGYKTFLTNGA